MATYQNEYTMGGETEEERRRREEQERQQAAQGGSMDLAGIANRYVDQRLGQAEQRLSDIGQIYNDPAAALEQRLGMTPEVAANTEVQSTQVKTYGDGSQEEIVKRQLPAPQPVAQVPGPVAPQAQPAPQMSMAPAAQPANPMGAQQTQDPAEIQRRADAIRAMMAQSQQQTQPAAQAQPTPQAEMQASGPINPAASPPNIGQPPQPGPGVQVAGPAQMPPAATPTGQTQVAAPAAMPSLAQGGAQAQAAVTPEERQQQAIVAAHNETDPAKRVRAFAGILGDANTSEGNKALANKYIAEDYIKQRSMRDAEQKIAEATPNELARYMKEQKKEGSYVKAILLARLGLTDLARREQELISPELKMDTAVVGSDKFTVVRDARGGIETAFDINGNRASQEQLAKISAAAMPTKSFLLPQSGGGLMQKTIMGEDGKPVVITGQVFTDPQTRETYFQAGNKKYDTSGLSTPAQNVQNVYSSSGARQQGTQDAQTGTTFVGGQGGGGGAVADPAAAQRAQGDVAALDREIAGLNRLPASDPTKQTRLATLNQERVDAQKRLAQAGGPIPGGAAGTGGIQQTGGAGAQRPGENFVQYQDRIKREGALAQSAAEANIALGKEERSKFLDYEEKDIVPKADAAGAISSTRKSQLKGPDGILANPEIVGMMSGQGGSAAEVGNIIRDLVTGARTDDELSTRVAGLGLTQRQKDVLYNQIQLNRQIAPKTLKENAGAGSVSDAEQKANRDAAINIAKVPLYTAVTMLSKDQFDKDQSVARQAFRNANPGLGTVRAFNDAWGKEKSKLDGEYNQIYAARAQYIAKYYNDGQNPGAIVDAYKHYPVPEFNRQTGRWDYGTEYSRKAARPKLNSFER
jgi:hypothetical protein